MEDLGGQTYSTRLCVVVLQRNLANIIAHGSGAPIASAGGRGTRASAPSNKPSLVKVWRIPSKFNMYIQRLNGFRRARSTNDATLWRSRNQNAQGSQVHGRAAICFAILCILKSRLLSCQPHFDRGSKCSKIPTSLSSHSSYDARCLRETKAATLPSDELGEAPTLAVERPIFPRATLQFRTCFHAGRGVESTELEQRRPKAVRWQAGSIMACTYANMCSVN